MPEFLVQASLQASKVDNLFWFLIIMSTLTLALIAALIVGFCIRFRSKNVSDEDTGAKEHSSRIEWSIVAIFFAAFFSIFIWSARMYVDRSIPAKDAREIFVVAKQWMWKFQHPSGIRELDQLHLEVNKPVKLTMISQDVIHSFFVPAFRVKQDLLPGRYTVSSFTPSKIGTFHLFCAELCGAQHSTMRGTVIVQNKADFERWNKQQKQLASIASQGAQIFRTSGCPSCHQIGRNHAAPDLSGIHNRIIALNSGKTVTATKSYLRESIVNPDHLVVAGYKPVMPAYEGRFDESELIRLVAYIETISTPHKNRVEGL